MLSRVLNTVAGDSGSIMTINQGIPLQGVANTTISIETKNLTVDLEALLDKLRMIDGVKRLQKSRLQNRNKENIGAQSAESGGAWQKICRYR